MRIAENVFNQFQVAIAPTFWCLHEQDRWCCHKTCRLVPPAVWSDQSRCISFELKNRLTYIPLVLLLCCNFRNQTKTQKSNSLYTVCVVIVLQSPTPKVDEKWYGTWPQCRMSAESMSTNRAVMNKSQYFFVFWIFFCDSWHEPLLDLFKNLFPNSWHIMAGMAGVRLRGLQVVLNMRRSCARMACYPPRQRIWTVCLGLASLEDCGGFV